jgi:hypothetical protein
LRWAVKALAQGIIGRGLQPRKVGSRHGYLVQWHAAEDYTLACPLLEESVPWQDRSPANLSGGSAPASRYRLRKNPADGVIPIPQSRGRNLALSVFKPMRDSSSPPAPRNDSANGFSRSLVRLLAVKLAPANFGVARDPGVERGPDVRNAGIAVKVVTGMKRGCGQQHEAVSCLQNANSATSEMMSSGCA